MMNHDDYAELCERYDSVVDKYDQLIAILSGVTVDNTSQRREKLKKLKKEVKPS